MNTKKTEVNELAGSPGHRNHDMNRIHISPTSARFDTEQIKAANPLPELVERLTGEPLRRYGDHKITHCPFHDEQSPSFNVCDDHAHCYGCGEHISDSISFAQKFYDIDFKAACEKLGGSCDDTVTANSGKVLKKRERLPEPKYKPTASEITVAAKAVRNLVEDDAIRAKIAAKRGWESETLKGLALESSLGWLDGKIWFLYSHGVKCRWIQNGERRFKWEYGKARDALWRGEYLILLGNDIDEVWITEGETDCITLIDRGIDTMDADQKTLAVALPGATTWNPEWNLLFTGKRVILCPDDDPAGGKMEERITKELSGIASEILVHQIKTEVTHG
ncbi:MAG: toprim domain-containing protein [Verrucomicrobiae bacterium]|nr:toprim domain-containing protein [Verrucomicrobiae bacterium]